MKLQSPLENYSHAAIELKKRLCRRALEVGFDDCRIAAAGAPRHAAEFEDWLKKGAAGEVNPATQQIDFYIRSPQQNPKNKPNRDVFLHFFGMEVTWK